MRILNKKMSMNDEIKKYIDKQKPQQKKILIQLRKMIKKMAPLAEEGMSYGVPAFKLNGNLVVYAAFKNHIGIYPEPETILAFAKELESYETAKGTIKFKLDEPVPYKLIEMIIKYKYEKLTKSKTSEQNCRR